MNGHNDMSMPQLATEGNGEFVQSATNNDIEKVKSLLASGEKVDVQGPKGWTALRAATNRGHYTMVMFLLSQGAYIEGKSMTGHTALIMAASCGHTNILRLLLDAGAQPDARDTYGSTALMEASQRGFVDIAKELLQRGADPNIQSRSGKTALMFAAENGSLALVKLLVEKGAISDFANTKDLVHCETALFLAERRGHKDIVDYLSATAGGFDAFKDYECFAVAE